MPQLVSSHPHITARESAQHNSRWPCNPRGTPCPAMQLKQNPKFPAAIQRNPSLPPQLEWSPMPQHKRSPLATMTEESPRQNWRGSP